MTGADFPRPGWATLNDFSGGGLPVHAGKTLSRIRGQIPLPEQVRFMEPSIAPAGACGMKSALFLLQKREVLPGRKV